MKKCNRCEAQLDDDSIFCENCGARVQETEAPPAVMPEKKKKSCSIVVPFLSVVIAVLIVLVSVLSVFQITDIVMENKNAEGNQSVEEEKVTAWVITSIGDTEYIYNENGECVKTVYTNDDGTTTEYEHKNCYDRFGNLTTEQDGGGVGYYETFNEYNDMTGFIVFTNDQLETYDYMYDADGNILTQIHYMDGTFHDSVEYEYTDDGNIERKREHTYYIYGEGKISSSYLMTEYCYNEAGELETEIMYEYEYGEPVETSRKVYEYDENNRLVRIINKRPDGTSSVAEEYEYQSDGCYDVYFPYDRTACRYDKHGNLLYKFDKETGNIWSSVLTYKAVEVSPLRAKSIERYNHKISFYALQK